MIRNGGIFMVGDRIKIVRESNKMSQVEFGKSLNVTKQTVSNWENNNVQPSVDILKSIALEYGVSTDWMIVLLSMLASNYLYILSHIFKTS